MILGLLISLMFPITLGFLISLEAVHSTMVFFFPTGIGGVLSETFEFLAISTSS